jgi:hypothetical protein
MMLRQEAEKLVKIIRPYPVEHLYKYRAFDPKNLRDIFVNKRIYLPDASKFNDPFECRPAVTYHTNSRKRTEYLKELTKVKFPVADRKTRRKLMKGKASLMTNETLLRHTYDNLVASIGVYCLSEKRDDLLMWSHYATSHRGLCIEFDAKTEGSLFWQAFKVVYQDDYPVVNVMDMGNGDEFRKALLTKCTCWRHEEERRILKMEDDGGPGYYAFGSECLTGVIFGALMSEEEKSHIVSWIDGYPSRVALYQAKLNGQSYKLDIDPIELNKALKPTRKHAAATGKPRGRAAQLFVKLEL